MQEAHRSPVKGQLLRSAQILLWAKVDPFAHQRARVDPLPHQRTRVVPLAQVVPLPRLEWARVSKLSRW